MGAATFTRERESGSWEGIRLSLLSPATIIAGKLATPLLTCTLLSAPLWPILLLCVRSVDQPDAAATRSIWLQPGVTLVQTVGALLVCAATAWCYTAWGMFLSWRCRNTSAATGWVIGTLFVPLVVIPALAGTVGAGSVSTDARLEMFVGVFHPFYALNGLVYQRHPLPVIDAVTLTAALCVMLHIVVGGVLLVLLQRSMQHGTRRRESPARQRNASLAFNVRPTRLRPLLISWN